MDEGPLKVYGICGQNFDFLGSDPQATALKTI